VSQDVIRTVYGAGYRFVVPPGTGETGLEDGAASSAG
jgi:hypothetical protein